MDKVSKRSMLLTPNQERILELVKEGDALRAENERLRGQIGQPMVNVVAAKEALRVRVSNLEAENERLRRERDDAIDAEKIALLAIGKESERLRAALAELVDTEPCRLDHEGFCQTHSLSRPCAVAAALNLLGRDKCR